MREQVEPYIVLSGRGSLFEQIRRIGLAGEALAQLRADYERKPSDLVREAIKRKIAEIADLGVALDEEGTTVALVSEGRR